MRLYRYQLSSILECARWNNFVRSIDDDMGYILRHNMISAQVDKNVIATIGHDNNNNLLWRTLAYFQLGTNLLMHIPALLVVVVWLFVGCGSVLSSALLLVLVVPRKVAFA